MLLAGVLLPAAGLVTMAPFQITRSFSPFECLFLSSETKFLCFSLSNLVLSGAINTFLYASLFLNWCKCTHRTEVPNQHFIFALLMCMVPISTSCNAPFFVLFALEMIALFAWSSNVGLEYSKFSCMF